MWTDKDRGYRSVGIKEANICFFASFAKVLDKVDVGKSYCTR